MEMPQEQEQEHTLAELMFEYEQLRQEILQNDVLTLQILGATVLLVGTIMGIAFSEAVKSFAVKGVLFFMADVVALVGMLQHTDRGRSSFLIASYLRIFTEDKMRNVQWETRLSKFRKYSHGRGYGKFISDQLWAYVFIVVANFALGGFHILLDFQNSPLFPGVISLLILGLLVTFWLVRVIVRRYIESVFRHQETFDPIWRKVREEENEPQ